MKNLKILFLLSCIYTTTVKSQFFGQRKYPNSFIVSDAKKTNIHSNGFLNAGYVPFAVSSKIFSVVKTDSQGDYSSSDDFSVSYQVYKDLSCNVLTTIVPKSFGTSIIETGNSSTSTTGSRYAVVTSCYGSSSGYGCVFVTLDQIGNVVNQAYYDFPSTTTGATKPLITESNSAGTYYISGNYTDNGTGFMYVMSVNVSGTINWSKVYKAGLTIFPNGMIESPYNSGELVLIGECDPDPAQSPFLNRANDGFFMKLSTVTSNAGTVLTFNCYGDDPISAATCNYFSSIAPANSTYGGSNGYIIGGLSDPYSASINHYGHSWMLKLKPNGVIVWTKMIQGSNTTNSMDVTGVLERLGTSGLHEYYGVTSSGASNDISVFKLDRTGSFFLPTPPVNNEFIYTGAGGGNPAYITNINSTSTNDGIQVYGTQNSPTYNYFVKAYFNGASNCNESLSTIITCENGPASVITIPYIVSPGLSQYTCPSFNVITSGTNPNAYTTLTNGIVTPCGATSLSSGSNARSIISGINKYNGKKEIVIGPNPTCNKTQLTFQIDKEVPVEIDLYNSIGQFIKSIYVSKENNIGNHEIEIDFQSLNLENGVYFLYSTINQETSKEKIIFIK